MAPINPNVSRLSSPTLSDIIELEPELEPWCAGYAESKGRRCQKQTNAHGRRVAMRILDQGTRDILAGRCVDELLADLAPHVLCTTWHQPQASSLVHHWKEQVSSYLSSRATSSRSSAPAESSSTSDPSRITENDLEAQYAALNREKDRLDEMIQSLLSASREANESSSQPRRRVDGPEDRDSIRNSTSSIERETVTRPGDTTVAVEPVGPTRQSTNTAPSEEQAHGADRRTPATASDPRQIPETSVTRREVEGDCGICLCQLQTPRSDLNASVEAEEQEAEDEEGQHRENREERADEELVWCKAKCGVNYHKACIEEWLAKAEVRTPPCPSCRRIWRL